MDLSKDLKYDYTYRPPDHDGSQDAIASVLRPDERILWSGQPSRKLLVLRASDLALVPFALFWTGFSLFWELGALVAVFESEGALDPFTLCFPLFGVPFVLIGFYLLGGRFVGDFYIRRRTWYALTDRRVLALTTLRERNVASMPLQTIDRVDIDLHKDGRGTLTFHGTGDRGVNGWRTRYVVNSATTVNGFPLFEQIENPKKAYDLVLEAQEDLWARQRIEKPQGG